MSYIQTSATFSLNIPQLLKIEKDEECPALTFFYKDEELPSVVVYFETVEDMNKSYENLNQMLTEYSIRKAFSEEVDY